MKSASGLFGASLTGTGTTNASGLAASPVFTANGTTGAYNVSGGIGTTVPAVAYSLTNTGPPASIAATAGTPQNTLGGQPYATALQATVRDSGNTPVFGVTVTFTLVPNAGSSGTFPGNAASATAVTNINGVATAPTLTANSTGGTFTVNATASGVGLPAVFNLTICAIVCPGNITHGTDPNLCTAVITYATPSTAAGCGTVACSPASGSVFPKGVTTVTCTLTPGAVSCSFTVTVNDTQNPSITCPANIVKSTDPNLCSAVVTFSTTATDNCGTPAVVCTPASGSIFAKGTATVNCTATDGSNNTSSCSFSVTVNDTQAPSITCPANITQPAALGLCSAIVTYSAPVVSDNCPGVGAPSCAPASGSTFQKGATAVTCSVSDAANNHSSCSFNVTVIDTQAPAITCPANIITDTVNAGDASVAVSFAAPVATDNCPGVAVVCVPPSGSQFPRGTTTVTCTATDTSGNHTSCAFTVTVFDYVIVDDSNGKILRFVSTTGQYDFFDCRKGTSLSRTGVVSITSCKTTLSDTGPDSKHPDRNLSALVNPCTRVGNARLVYAGLTNTLSDPNTSNNIVRCP